MHVNASSLILLNQSYLIFLEDYVHDAIFLEFSLVPEGRGIEVVGQLTPLESGEVMLVDLSSMFV